MGTISDVLIEKHLDLLQGIINRISNNCSNCKSWCITVVSAIVVLAIDKSKFDLLYIALLPLIIFYFLDSYYLSIEREFIALHKSFVKKFHKSNLLESDLFLLSIKNGFFRRIGLTICAAVTSASTAPFYIILIVLILITKTFIH